MQYFTKTNILPKLKLTRVFPAVHFVNANLLEERAQILFSEKELRELPDDSPKNFKKSNIDCYMERPSATSWNGKYSALNAVLYIFVTQTFPHMTDLKINKTCKHQPDELDDNLVQNNHEECSYLKNLN